MNNEIIKTLQESLQSLSKSPTIHFTEVARELKETRIALLQLQGVDMDAYFENLVKYDETMQKIKLEIRNLQTERDQLLSQVAKTKSQKEKLDDNTENK